MKFVLVHDEETEYAARPLLIIRILKEQEASVSVADLCRKHGVSDVSIYRWKAKFGGMEVSEAKRLRALEDENTRLKRLLADYTDVRPHSQLGWKMPSEFAFVCHLRRALALRYAESSAPAPVVLTAQSANPIARADSD